MLLLLLLVASVSAEINCTLGCDGDPQSTNVVTFCGTDNATTHRSAVATFNPICYLECGIAALYAGECGCPNNCTWQEGQGHCDNSTCACNEGWGGADCSSPVWPNTCSGHGRITNKTTTMPFDFCECDCGYTGTYCGDALNTVGVAPWGSVLPSFFAANTSQDEDPFFNFSALATIRFEFDPEEYRQILLPLNLFNSSTIRAEMFFDNGVVRANMTVGLKVKGKMSRLELKKGLAVKTDEYVDNQRLLGVKKFGLKTGTSGDSVLHEQMFGTFVRALGAPIQHTSFVLVFLNGYFQGLHSMHEYTDESAFLTQQTPSKDGNLMGLSYDVRLNFSLGDNQTAYEDTVVHKYNYTWEYYEQSRGNGNWSDFISLLSDLRYTSSNISSIMDVDLLLRFMIVESFLLSDDNFRGANNYFLFNMNDAGKWYLLEHDFDHAFSNPFGDGVERNVYLFSSASETVPLKFFFSHSVFNATFLSQFRAFLGGVFGGAGMSPEARHRALGAFVLPWYARDRFSQVAWLTTNETFAAAVNITASGMTYRAREVAAQLPPSEDTETSFAVALIVTACCVVVLAGGGFLLFRYLRGPSSMAQDYVKISPTTNRNTSP